MWKDILIFYSPALIFYLIGDVVFTLIFIHTIISNCLGRLRWSFQGWRK